MPGPAEPPAAASPAGFWQRATAWTLDAAMLMPATLWLSRDVPRTARASWETAGSALIQAMERPMQWALDGADPLDIALRMRGEPALAAAAAALESALWQTLAVPVLAFAALACLWHVGFERSPWGGSPGKRLLGLQVVDARHQRPAAWRTLWRFLAGTASWATLNLGHALAALPPRHRALHDLLSATGVDTCHARLPAWAKVWLWLIGLAFVAANGWLLVRLDALLETALAGVAMP